MCAELPLFRRWWSQLPSRVSETTAKTYRYMILRALADLETGVIEATPAQLDRYMDTLQPQYVRVFRSALGNYFDFAMRAGVIDENPFARTKKRRERRNRVRRALTRDELTRLLLATVYIGVGKTRWTGGERLALLFLAQYYCGLRPGEMVALTVDDVKLDTPHPRINITETKTGYDRIVPLSPNAAAVLRALVDGRRGYLCHVGRTQYWSHFRRAALAVGIDPQRARPYALRHSSATHMLEAGISLRVVADVLGHCDTRHTVAYTVPSEDDRWRAVAAL